ncbi:hypothetical protein [Bacillus thuringiensis]|uniref:hypothetical protein n=1 Tax=Bacillus thuringiensis TaxID=1428 RepID=UPI00119D877C|nr:hypothetical protein [Bacillus thuringiensis]
MQTKNFRNIVETFNKFYLSGDILVDWGQQARLQISSNIDHEIEELNLSKDEFANECFKIISIATHISTGEIESVDSNDGDIQIVQDVVLRDKDLMQYINVQASSKQRILDSIEHEILTKRSPINVKNILTHSISLTINTDDRNRENQKSLTIELSKTDAKTLIESVNRALVDIEKLELEDIS